MYRLLKNTVTLLPPFLLLCFSSLQPLPLNGQLQYSEYYKLTEQNGLSSDFTQCMIRDREGFYWIATADGLNRFDGTSFRVFRYDKNDSSSLSHNSCLTLLEGQDGDIWVGTQKGLSRYQKRTGTFKRYYFHHPKYNDDIINPVYTLMQDKNGNVWMSNYGLWKINSRTDEIISYTWEDKPTTLSDASQTAHAAYDSTANGIWLITASHLNFFSVERHTFFNSLHNPLQWKVFNLAEKRPFIIVNKNSTLCLYAELQKMFYTFNPAENMLRQTYLPFEKNVYSMSGDKNGNILFRLTEIASRIYRPETNQLDSISSIAEINFSAEGGLINSMYTDPAGNQWLCTRKGIVVARKQETYITTHKAQLKKNKLPSLRRIAVINDTSLAAGSMLGLFEYNPARQTMLPFTGKEFQYSITALFNAGDSVLWVATVNSDILFFDLQKKKLFKKISVPGMAFFILPDKYGSFWVGTWNKGLLELDGNGTVLHHYTQGNGLAHQGYFLGGYYDGADELWMGLNGGNGFARLNIKTREFRHYKIQQGGRDDFSFNSVNAIYKDKKNNIWLGTYGGGLFSFNQSAGTFRNFNYTDGLSGEFVNTITEDKRGNLWVSTNNGIDIFNPADSTFAHINTKLEFDSHDFINNLSLYKERLYYISNEKITIIDPEKFNGGRQDASIIISNVRVSGKERYEESMLDFKLRHNQNFFNFEFSVLRVSPDIPAEYKYKLEGFDREWNFSGRRGIANYTNVPPGKYVLLLNATNESGIWNTEPVKISIYIKPPFWNTWWFYTLAALAVAAVITAFVQYRFRQIKTRQKRQMMLVVDTQEKEKKIISAQLHDDLGVRLSALKYFVSSLKQYLQPGNTAADDIYHKTISSIDESVEDIRYLLINLSPKTLTEYGYLMAVEDLVNKLQRLHIIRVELLQRGLEQRLPADVESGLYRITQELINNTLKHAEAQTIRLHIEKKDAVVQLNYSDDGKGFDTLKSSKGYGLENIHTRVALLNGKIEWKQPGNKITGVSVTIPLPHTPV